MDKDNEIAHQVDALIRKNAVSEAIEDRNVPLLTDFVEGSATAANPATPRPPHILSRLDDNEIDALSHDIFARVTERIDRELAHKLEARLTHEISAKIKVAVANVLIDMRQTIANEIGDAVNAVLADKLR